MNNIIYIGAIVHVFHNTAVGSREVNQTQWKILVKLEVFKQGH